MSKAFLLSLAVVGSGLGGCIEPILPGEQRATFGWLPVEYSQAESRNVHRDDLASPESRGEFSDDQIDPTTDPRQGDTQFHIDSLRGFTAYRTVDNRTRTFGYYSVPGITMLRVTSDTQVEVNNMDDLVTLSTAKPEDIRVARRETGAAAFTFPADRPAIDDLTPLLFEQQYTRYFQCYRASGKVLVGWRLGASDNLECYLRE